MRQYAYNDIWREQPIPLIARFEIRGINAPFEYEIKSETAYYLYHNPDPSKGKPVYLSLEKHPGLQGIIAGILFVSENKAERHSAFKAMFTSLDANYKMVVPDSVSPVASSQVMFDLGYFVSIVQKQNPSESISVKVSKNKSSP